MDSDEFGVRIERVVGFVKEFSSDKPVRFEMYNVKELKWIYYFYTCCLFYRNVLLPIAVSFVAVYVLCISMLGILDYIYGPTELAPVRIEIPAIWEELKDA